MILNDIGIVLANNIRSSAYLQLLLKNNYVPSRIFFLNNIEIASSPKLRKKLELNSEKIKEKYFDYSLKAIDVAKIHNLEYKTLDTDDLNSDLFINELRDTSEKYFIFSGPGGQILKKPVLSLGKDFLHLHPGKVPSYRGSTTIYYGILDHDVAHVSAFFLREKIDTGPLIKIKSFKKPEYGEIIDFIYDPFIRSSLLIHVLNDYVRNNYVFNIIEQSNDFEETYYIIHPLLKHIAILSCK